MTIHDMYLQLLAQLYEVYDHPEAANISDMVVEYVTGQRKIDRLLYKNMPVSKQQEEVLEQITQKLLQHMPVQYALGEAWFGNLKLFVNENVLIPRPETEELVAWISNDIKADKAVGLRLLDVGTGSGCIAIALKKAHKRLLVYALDISNAALHVARKNAKNQDTEIDFFEVNFLVEQDRSGLGIFDVLVSNPPYVQHKESVDMQRNVLAFEPHNALFVPDADALIFYESMAAFGSRHLAEKGLIYAEINENFGREVAEVFERYGYAATELRKDMQGKDRMIKVRKG